MLKKYSSIFKILFLIVDSVLMLLVWSGAYYLRFVYQVVSLQSSPPQFMTHLQLFVYLWILFIIGVKNFDLYYPVRIQRVGSIFLRCFKVVTFIVLMFIFLMYFMEKGIHYSRLTLILFWFFSGLIFFFSRMFTVALMRFLRKKGFNQRHVIIIGTGSLAKKLYEEINLHLEMGFNIIGFVGNEKYQENVFCGESVLGFYKDLPRIAERYRPDQLIFALPAKEERFLRRLIAMIDTEIVSIKVALDLGDFLTLGHTMEDFKGIPILSLRESSLYGWMRVLKRFFDIIVSLCVLVLTLPLFIMIAVAVKSTSKGPLFYKQERMGIDGRLFKMIKFRTMKVDAESQAGPAWAKPEDPRRTPIGAFLRRMSLDEFPQFINVLNGEMSIIGPRPERPFFIEQFKKKVPGYMLRHKMKAGITGLAQIKGLRGNTSIEERIKQDLYYIEHWSLWLDIKILARTIPAVIKGKGAY